MNKSLSVTYVIVGLIVVLAIGFGLGFWMAKSPASATKGTQQTTKVEVNKSLTSTLVKFISVLGQVKSVSATSMVISNKTDTMLVKIKSTASVYQSVNGKQVKGTIGDIKVGQTVNASTVMTSSGELEASGIVILAPATK